MNSLSFNAFHAAFSELIPLKPQEIAGRRRALGGARGVGVDLLFASFNSDHVHSAAIQLAYADGAADFDDFSAKCLRTFVSVVLGNPQAADVWINHAFCQLKADGVSSCGTSHENFVLTLLQQKPYQMFLLTAVAEEAA